ncbi:MAG: serine/threonine protein kinase [Myxococcota bacterium]|nr:serine/threonine protein kinase [Myxococcota bacterium]
MTSRPGIEAPGPRDAVDERGRSGLRSTTGASAATEPPPARRGSASVRPEAGPALTPGVVVADRYRIQELIGQGGMGTVYRAEQIAMKREVALKVMHASVGEGGHAATTARFEREAQAASRITSPHVVTIHDFGHGDGDLLYLAMELLQGESLAHRILRKGTLPWREAVAITIQIARALQVAHGVGVVHRDLKPDNIFLVVDDTGAGQVKVLDFGIARLLGTEGPEQSHLTSADLVVGTPLYMSPESCSRGAIGPAADLYSLGVIVFEMITGKPPFDEREPVLVMSRHLEARAPRVSERRPDLDVPASLEGTIAGLLEKKPSARPPNAAALIATLRKLSDSTARITAPAIGVPPLRAEPTLYDSSEAHPRRPTAGLMIGAIGGALALAVLVALGIGLAVSSSRDPVVASELPPAPATLPARETLPAPAPSPAPAVAPATVEVRFEITPAHATVLADGAPIEGRSLVVPRDGTTHHIEVRADDYEPRALEVGGDVDRVVSIDLRRAPRSRAHRSRTRRTRRSAPPTKRRDPILREW